MKNSSENSGIALCAERTVHHIIASRYRFKLLVAQLSDELLHGAFTVLNVAELQALIARLRNCFRQVFKYPFAEVIFSCSYSSLLYNPFAAFLAGFHNFKLFNRSGRLSELTDYFFICLFKAVNQIIVSDILSKEKFIFSSLDNVGADVLVV